MQLAYNDIKDFAIARTDGVALAEEAVTTTPANAAYSYLAQDHLGTGRFVYNQSKTQTGAFEHYPYGARYSASGTAPYHEFTGKPWDADASLYYFPYRYYRPDMECWTSSDPLGLVDGPNVYGYVGDNPTNGPDILGLRFHWKPSGYVCADNNCKQEELDKIRLLPEDSWHDKDGNVKWLKPLAGACVQSDGIYSRRGRLKIPGGNTCTIKCGCDGKPEALSCRTFPFCPKPRGPVGNEFPPNPDGPDDSLPRL